MRFIAQLHWTKNAIQKVADHGLTMADVDEIIDTAYDEDVSDSSGLPVRFGYAIDGTHCIVVFRWLAKHDVDIVTAYPVPEPTR